MSINLKHIPLYAKILVGMAIGLAWGFSASSLGLIEFTQNWIKPFGTIFINLLKLIAIPLILASLVHGISDLSDIGKLSRMGGKTIALYLSTTVVAISIGLLSVNIINPGSYLPAEQREYLGKTFASDIELSVATAHETKQQGPLQVLVDIIPNNLFHALSKNTSMLQVICFAILFGIAIVMSPQDTVSPVKNFFTGLNKVILVIVDIIMQYAPLGVFALLASLNIDLQLLKALSVYSLNVVFGLAAMMFLFYPLLLKTFTKVTYLRFMKAVLPAQILGFSTSSSAATLPVTMDCVEKNLGVSEEVSSFVLPLGATINMDGTSIHQGISAVFIAQAFGMDLSFGQQLTILLTCVLSSIGAAAVPGAGIIMLIIVLEAVGIDPAGLTLILAVDRPLDMLRTSVNVTGDSAVATIVAHSDKNSNV